MKSSPDDIGAKAYNLRRLQDLGIAVPEFVIIKQSDYAALSDRTNHLHYPLILRSSTSLEDRNNNSFAGVFHSITVKNSAGLVEAFKQVQSMNKQSVREVASAYNLAVESINVHYIVQEHIASIRGGVMKVPQSKKQAFVIESGSSPDAITAGLQNPEITVIKPDGSEADLIPWQSELLNIARQIRDNFELDQEFEWLQDQDRRVYVLQTRPYASKNLSPVQILRNECQRLSRYRLHAGSYQTESLPDIDKPTPLTLELIQYIYTNGLLRQRAVRKNTDPLIIIAANIYLDKTSLRKSLLFKRLSSFMYLLKAYKAYNSESSNNTGFNKMGVAEIRQYIDRSLINPIVETSNELQLVQSLLVKKLKISNTHHAFLNPSPGPLQKAAKARSPEELLSLFWYLADNEYELSAQRYSETNTGLAAIRQLADTMADPADITALRSELMKGQISAFDAAYCNNLFKVYDYLCQRRLTLHNSLIEAIASLRKLLLAVDSRQKLQNLIWYATFDEITKERIPPADVLHTRRNTWQVLQSLPLPSPNKLASWGDLSVELPAASASGIAGVSLSPGIIRGTVGKDIKSVTALTQGTLLDHSNVLGIITERGGSLSHVAILAREYNIPIIRVENASLRFTLGMHVLIDADHSFVYME